MFGYNGCQFLLVKKVREKHHPSVGTITRSYVIFKSMHRREYLSPHQYPYTKIRIRKLGTCTSMQYGCNDNNKGGGNVSSPAYNGVNLSELILYNLKTQTCHEQNINIGLM